MHYRKKIIVKKKNFTSRVIKFNTLNSFECNLRKNYIENKMGNIQIQEKENCINFPDNKYNYYELISWNINNNKIKTDKLKVQISHNNTNASQIQFLNKKKKMIFSIIKRENKAYDRNKNHIIINKNNSFDKIHSKNYKDNILSNIQIHYMNFLVSFLNELIKKVIFEECYISKNLDKILNIEKYLLNRLDYIFKSNVKKENMTIVESIKIKDIISPSIELCRKLNIKNKNIKIMENINSINNTIKKKS